jgi:RNA binding exosome subunit
VQELCVAEEVTKDRILHSVQISTIAHATDDLEKVQSALRFFIPDSLRGRELFTRRYLQGHYGNPIVTFEAKLTKPHEVNQFTHHLAEQLPKSGKLLIKGNLGTLSDEEGNLFIRFNKQQALRGIVDLSDEDPIRVKLKFNRLGGDAQTLMREFLESD